MLSALTFGKLGRHGDVKSVASCDTFSWRFGKSLLFALDQVFEENPQLLLLFGVQGTCVELYSNVLLAVAICL
jgi:hypothetical protein